MVRKYVRILVLLRDLEGKTAIAGIKLQKVLSEKWFKYLKHRALPGAHIAPFLKDLPREK